MIGQYQDNQEVYNEKVKQTNNVTAKQTSELMSNSYIKNPAPPQN